MAQSVSSKPLSVLTEGQKRYKLNRVIRHSKGTVNQEYTAANHGASAIADTIFDNTTSKKSVVIKNSTQEANQIEHSREKDPKSSIFKGSHKRYLPQLTGNSKSELNPPHKKQRIDCVERTSTAQLTFESTPSIDCVAHRTRSKTLLPQRATISILSETAYPSKQQAKSAPDSNHSTSKNSRNNLLSYYRETRKFSGDKLQASSKISSNLATSTSPFTNKIKLNKQSRSSVKNKKVKNFALRRNSPNTRFGQQKGNICVNQLPTVTKGLIKKKNSARQNNSLLSEADISEDTLFDDNEETEPVKDNKAAADATTYHIMEHQNTGSSTIGGEQPLSGASHSGTVTTTLGNAIVSNASNIDSESDDNEVGRLQALLEARGLPPHLFGALGPRMTHILHKTIGSASSSKALQLLQGLQSYDESQQLQAAIEMCQMLVMGNEDTLAGFPIKQVVPALIALLRMEHNFDIMNNACRALGYMLEALPRSSGTVVEAVPVFLEKLQVIQCMDVAEQSLTALEILSRRHNKVILQASGVSACLTYLDFFSINAQRAALSITANCCLNLQSEEFHFLSDSMPLLASLLSQQDRKCVESVCTAFCRLVETFQHDPTRLLKITSKDLLRNLQHLLGLTPPFLSIGTFTSVVRMLSLMCNNCPCLAMELLKNDIASTLLYLLTGSVESAYANNVELISRSPAELFEITCLIGELMPRLPKDDIFVIDPLVDSSTSNMQDQVQWQWRDDRGTWHSYSAIDSRIIDAAHLNSDDEISISTFGRTYTVDFHSMQQINEDTGTTRPVQRKKYPNYDTNQVPPFSLEGQDLSVNALSTNEIPFIQPVNCFDKTTAVIGLEKSKSSTDTRISCLKEENRLASLFTKRLFNVLYEVYSSSAGPNVRYKCLRALLKMVYFASPELLKEVLKTKIVSSQIAGMVASNDLRIVVGGLQIAEILMKKLPDVFGTHFRREGVIHQINKLADPNNSICANSSPRPVAGISGLQKKLSHVQQTNTLFVDGNNFLPDTVKPNGTRTKSFLYGMSSLCSSTKPVSSPPHTKMASLQQIRTSINLFSEHSPQHFQPHHHVEMLQTSVSSTALASKVDVQSNVTAVSIPSSSSSTSTAMQNKMSDILKRKVPPKRKSQSSNRSKSRQDESVVQELLDRTAAKDSSNKSGRNTPCLNAVYERSRLCGNVASNNGTKTSFLASLNPARWTRQGSHSSSLTKYSSGSNCVSSHATKTISDRNAFSSNNRERTRQWIHNQAMSFVKRYTEQEIAKSLTNGTSILYRLSGIISKLDKTYSECIDALQELKQIILESDISPFEVNHSGLINSMLNFLTADDGVHQRDKRLRAFLHVFAGLPLENSFNTEVLKTMESTAFSAFVSKLNGCVTQLEQFPVKVHDVPTVTGGRSDTSALKFFNTHQLKCNLQRYPNCSNLRQWKGGTVKIDPLALVQAIERYLVVRGYGGIREETDDDSEEDMDDNVAAIVLPQNTFKHKLQFLIGDNILPYAMTVFQAVKQYSPLSNDQSEADTETEIHLGNTSIWAQQHTIYYRPFEEDVAINIDGSSHCVSENKSPSCSNSTSETLLKKNCHKNSSKLSRQKMELKHENCLSGMVSPLDSFLSKRLPVGVVNVHDASLDALCMLRIMNALNRHWESLYECVIRQNIINETEFVHAKMTAKVNRQLQDPLVIMTGNMPKWIQQIPVACPFLFPFETRHLLFYAVTFDRDRALHRLLEMTPDFNSIDTSERVAPRLDRRKRSISREEILKQAENILQDFCHSKALLEIQYENEVGTGLGPTLEFYALVSAELQRCELGLWNGDSYNQISSPIVDSSQSNPENIDEYYRVEEKSQEITLHADRSNDRDAVAPSYSAYDQTNMRGRSPRQLPIKKELDIQDVLIEGGIRVEVTDLPSYVKALQGLFPLPMGKTTKLAHVSRIKSKFKFLGKFMAKAVMDSRMLDLPFSKSFYRWLLNEENSLGLADLAFVAPEVQSTLVRLHDIVKLRDEINANSSLDDMEKTEKIELLDLDGCLISDLGLDFVLPGHDNVELRRGGRDIPVTIHNLHQYISLVTHWFLVEGVQKQFDALREGFDMIFPCHRLKMFYPEELENVFCGSGGSQYNRWDIKMLQECCRTDHGYTQDSQAIRFLFDILSSYNYNEQRLFLQFVTGSPRLPTGGFKSLNPTLTIVRKTLDVDQNPNDYLPSVMTCVNYLKLPEYSTLDIMSNKLKTAANEGSMCFHLS